MPYQTGTATPWREIEDPSQGGGGSSVFTYFRPGERPGPSELLAEQVRMDGAVRSLGPALGKAEAASLSLGWYGLDDDGQETLCDEDGWTASGEAVDEPRRCVLARVDVSED